MPSSFSERVAAALHELNCLKLSEDLIELTPTQAEYTALLDRYLAAAGGKTAEDVAAAVAEACFFADAAPSGPDSVEAARPLIARALLAERERAAKVCEEEARWREEAPMPDAAQAEVRKAIEQMRDHFKRKVDAWGIEAGAGDHALLAEARAALAALDRLRKWRKTRPTERGVYWMRTESHAASVVDVWECEDSSGRRLGFHYGNTAWFLDEWHAAADWFGPLPPPEDSDE